MVPRVKGKQGRATATGWEPEPGCLLLCPSMDHSGCENSKFKPGSSCPREVSVEKVLVNTKKKEDNSKLVVA